MATVLLVNPDYHEEARSFPIGLGVLTGPLEEAGYDVALLDIDSVGYSPDQVRAAVAEALRRHDPVLVGIAGMITTFRSVVRLIDHFRDLAPRVPIALGGSLPRTAPPKVRELLEADYLITGDGELPLTLLAHAVRGKESLDRIPNLMIRDDGRWLPTLLPEWRSPVAGEPMIDYSLFDVPSYIRPPNHSYFDVISGRGCVMNCNFCFKMTGDTVRKKTPEEMLDEIAFITDNYGINRISFADDNFGLTPKWILAMIEEKSRRGMDFEWRFQASVNTIRKEEFVKHMRDNGLRGVSIGIESGSSEVLRYIGKGLNKAHAYELIGWLQKAGIQVNATFILGMPIETEETIEDTRTFLRDLGFKRNFQMFLLAPYPGTSLYDYALENGHITDEIDYVEKLIGQQQLLVNLTKFSDEELIGYHREILAEFQGEDAVAQADSRQERQDRLLRLSA